MAHLLYIVPQRWSLVCMEANNKLGPFMMVASIISFVSILFCSAHCKLKMVVLHASYNKWAKSYEEDVNSMKSNVVLHAKEIGMDMQDASHTPTGSAPGTIT